jgi:hypothetical protein
MADFEAALHANRVRELESQIHTIKSTMLNVFAAIREHAENSDYDEIIALCDSWGEE